jgi:hypothetical protein
LEIGAILLGLALLLLVGAFVARPLFEGVRADPESVETNTDLIAEREAILAALADLDFDHRTGKIAGEDYQSQRAALVSRGAAILRRLDEADGADGRTGVDLDAEIEAAIAARRSEASQSPAATVTTGLAPKFCPNCGSPTVAGDRFCARCGTRLAAPEPARQTST